MLENKEQEKIAGIISDFFDGAVNEADIDILAIKIYEKYVAELEQELAELKEKDNYHLRYELAGADETITNLKEQLAEKDKEIESLTKQNSDMHTAVNMTITDTLMLKSVKDKEIEDLSLQIANLNSKITQMEEQDMVFHNQLAIQELEKVKMQLKDKTKMMSNEEHCYQQKVVSWLDICDQINNQIRELKGEKQ